MTVSRSSSVTESEPEAGQLRICDRYGCEFTPAPGLEKAGVDLSTLGLISVNGLRHPLSPGASGWYIWCGESMSDAPDFFDPICIDHLREELPLVADFLGLPPGSRFLIAGNHLDVWFDENLLVV